MSQERYIFLVSLHTLHIPGILSLLKLHEIILCGYLLLPLVLAAVDNAENQIADTHEKRHKLYNQMVSCIEELGVHSCGIVEYIVEERHDTKRNKLSISLVEYLREGGGGKLPDD